MTLRKPSTVHNDTLFVLNMAYEYNSHHLVNYNQFEKSWIFVFGYHAINRVRSAERKLRALAHDGEYVKGDGEGNFMPLRPFEVRTE